MISLIAHLLKYDRVFRGLPDIIVVARLLSYEEIASVAGANVSYSPSLLL